MGGFRNYGPLDLRKYASAFTPENIGDTASLPDNENFNDAPPSAIRPIALAPRQPGGMGARNPTADLQDQFTDVGSKLSAALNPNPVSTPRALLGALVSRHNPQLGSVITGDYQRQRAIQPLMQQEQLLGTQLDRQRQLDQQRISNENIQSEIQHRGKQEDYWQQLANAKQEPPPKGAVDKAIDDLVGQPNPETGKAYTYSDAFSHIQDVVQGAKAPKAPSEEDKAISDYLGAHGKPNTAANRDAARSTLKTRDRKAQDPDLADINKQLKEAQLAKAQEPTADEQRRADLARNMNENLDQLEEIANRRPDLFGPVAGRMTQAANVIGTSDPDKAKLKAIREYLGMASVGAHAMRNAQHVGTAADAVMNGFTNSPEAMKAAIGAARKSTGTFFADEQRRKNRALAIDSGGASAPAAPSGTVIKYDAQGNRVQ